MSISKKYGVPKETIQRMVNDGVLSCMWTSYDQVYAMFESKLNAGGKTKTSIYEEIADATGMTSRNVQYIISRYMK